MIWILSALLLTVVTFAVVGLLTGFVWLMEELNVPLPITLFAIIFAMALLFARFTS